MSLNHRYYTTLPRWGRRLNRRFVAAFGKPAGLWMPNDVINKAYDFSSNRNIGALSGGITTTPGGWGTFGQSWNLDGSSGYVSVSNFPYSTDLTILLLTKANSTAASMYALIKRGGQTDYNAIYQTGNLKLSFQIGNNNSATTITDPTNLDLNWHFWICTCIGSALVLYRDGNQVATGTLAGDRNLAANVGTTLYLGQNSQGSNFWNGKIGLSAIYPLGISAAQASALYSCLLTGEPFPLFGPEIIKRRYSTTQLVGSVFKFRRTLSQFGTRIGSRQIVG